MAGMRGKLHKTFLFSAVSAGLLMLESRRELRSVCLHPYRISIRNLPEEAAGRKIAFLSDFHQAENGRNNEKILGVVNRFSPDVVLVGGDFLNGGHDDMTPAVNLLNTLSEKYPVYMALGNHEKRIKEMLYDGGEIWKSFLGRISPRIRLLMNESVEIPGFGGVRLYGLDMDLYYYRKKNKERLTPDLVSDMIGKEEGISILLAHDPEQFPAYAGWGADLALSGHYHGGIIRLPVAGGLISPRFRLFPRYDKGLFRKDNSRMIVSGGLGQHTLKVRTGNIPEVVGITLEKE